MAKKENKVKYSLAIRVFQGFTTIFFILILALFTLNLSTSRKSLAYLCEKYVRSVEINEKYFDNYIEAGYTKEEARAILSDDKIYKAVSDVMTDRMLALFRYSTKYDYSIDACKANIRSVLVKYNTDNKISNERISSLTDFTCDISGITSMFVYDTPLAYRNAFLNTNELEDIRIDTSILKGIATLSKWYFLLTVCLMYLLLLFLIYFISNKKEREKIYNIMVNTSLYPSVICLGFSFGEKFGLQQQPIVTDYVFRNLIIVSIFGVIWGITAYVLLRKLFKKTNI